MDTFGPIARRDFMLPVPGGNLHFRIGGDKLLPMCSRALLFNIGVYELHQLHRWALLIGWIKLHELLCRAVDIVPWVHELHQLCFRSLRFIPGFYKLH